MKKNNQIKVYHPRSGVVFSKNDQKHTNSELQSKYDKRIVDLLHKIEFTDFTPAESYKLCMKLQNFLRKRRAIKPKAGHVYVPRTETGNYIINGKITRKKKSQ